MIDAKRQHHMWCTNYRDLRERCKMCERLYREYPVDDSIENEDDMLKKHIFSGSTIVRRGR